MPELAEYVDLTRFTPKRNKNPEEIGLGRNVTLFDELRKWAYRQVKKYKADGGYKEWLDACNAWALNRNGEFKAPSGPPDKREVWHIAKPVAKWTWTRFDIAASDKRFGTDFRRSDNGRPSETRPKFGSRFYQGLCLRRNYPRIRFLE